MPHLVERQNDCFAGDFRLGKLGGFGPNPAIDADMRNAEQPGDHAIASIAHAIQQQRQRFYCRRFPARLGRREIAAARLAAIALYAAHHSVFHVFRCRTALADNLRHGPFPLWRTTPVYPANR
jgi:hypothetical protein